MSNVPALYQINGTNRTVSVTAEFAARFGGMTLVPEVVSAKITTPSKAKTSIQTNSSKEGK